MDEITKAVMEKSFEQDGKTCLACGSAYEIAGKLDIPVGKIGDYCKANSIKIRACQLKCFK